MRGGFVDVLKSFHLFLEASDREVIAGVVETDDDSLEDFSKESYFDLLRDAVKQVSELRENLFIMDFIEVLHDFLKLACEIVEHSFNLEEHFCLEIAFDGVVLSSKYLEVFQYSCDHWAHCLVGEHHDLLVFLLVVHNRYEHIHYLKLLVIHNQSGCNLHELR